MNNFSDLIKRRRSIRKFTKELLSPGQVEAILKAGLMAPSSKSSTPWQFLVIEDKDKLERLSRCKKSSSRMIADCAMAVVVMADPFASDVWIEDAAIASIMIQLQAEDMGLGSCWVQIRERVTAGDMPSDDYIRELFDIPLQLQILSVIAIGNKEEDRPPFDEQKLQWEKIHIDKF